MLDDLERHYGSHACFAKALIDIYNNKDQAVAVAIASRAFIGDDATSSSSKSDFAWQQVSGSLSDRVGELVAAIKTVTWRVVVQVGDIPDALDAIIANLKSIQTDVREKLHKSLNWIGKHITAFWNYILELIPEKGTWLKSIFSSLSFDWLVDSVTAAIKYAARQFASAFVYIFETLRSLVYDGISTMSDMFGGMMESMASIPGASKRAVVKALYFYTSSSSDLARCVVQPFPVFEGRLQAFKSQVILVTREVVNVAKDTLGEDSDLLESKIRKSWLFEASYGKAFQVAESIVQWLFEHILWFANALKRLVSAARTCFEATFVYSYLFSTVLGDQMKQVADYVKQNTDPMPLIEAMGHVESLLDGAGDVLPKEAKAQLQRALDAAQVVLEDMQAQNTRVVLGRDNKSHAAQYEMNHKLSDVLTQLHMGDEDIDEKAASEVYEFYTGRPLIDQYEINRETVFYLEAQYALAVSNLIGDKWNHQKAIGIKVDGQDGEMDPVRKEELEIDEDEKREATTIKGVEEALLLADENLATARKALEAFERDPTNGIVRNEFYMQAVSKMEEQIIATTKQGRAATRASNTAIVQVIKDHQVALMGFALSQTPNHDKHISLLFEVNDAFQKRNMLAKRLRKKLEPADKWKGRMAIASALWSTGLCVAFYGAVYMFGDVAFVPGVAPAPGADPVDKVHNWLTEWIDWTKEHVWGTGTSVSLSAGLNLQTWINVLKQFQHVSVARVFELPRLFQYVTILLTSVPIVIALGMFVHLLTCSLGACMIDAFYDIGVKERNPVDGSFRISRARFWHYMRLVLKGGRTSFGYAFVRVSSAVVALLTSQIEFLREITRLVPVLVAASNPIGMLQQSLMGRVETLRKIEVLPSSTIIQSILRPEGAPIIDSVEVYQTIVHLLKDLPKNDPLLTGSHILNRTRPAAAAALEGGGGPKIEEVDDDEIDVPHVPKKIEWARRPALVGQ